MDLSSARLESPNFTGTNLLEAVLFGSWTGRARLDGTVLRMSILGDPASMAGSIVTNAEAPDSTIVNSVGELNAAWLVPAYAPSRHCAARANDWCSDLPTMGELRATHPETP